MKEDLNDAYNITCESITAISASPFLETLRKEGLEVLHLVDLVETEKVIVRSRMADSPRVLKTSEYGGLPTWSAS